MDFRNVYREGIFHEADTPKPVDTDDDLIQQVDTDEVQSVETDDDGLINSTEISNLSEAGYMSNSFNRPSFVLKCVMSYSGFKIKPSYKIINGKSAVIVLNNLKKVGVLNKLFSSEIGKVSNAISEALYKKNPKDYVDEKGKAKKPRVDVNARYEYTYEGFTDRVNEYGKSTKVPSKIILTPGNFKIEYRGNTPQILVSDTLRLKIIGLFANVCHKMYSRSKDEFNFNMVLDNVLKYEESDVTIPKGSIEVFTDKNPLNIAAFSENKVIDTFIKEFGDKGVEFEYLRGVLDGLNISLTSDIWAKVKLEHRNFYDKAKKDNDNYSATAKANAKSVYVEARAKHVDKLPTKENLELIKALSSKSDVEMNNDFKSIEPDWIVTAFMDANKATPDNPRGTSYISLIDYLESIISVEAEIESNSVNNNESAQKVWESIINDFNNLVDKYEGISKDKVIRNMLPPVGQAALKSAGATISGISMLFGGALGLLSLLPGGVQYASYFSGLAKHGRRIGKLLSNAGSPLKSKSSDHEKHHKPEHKDKDEKELDKKAKKFFGIGKKDKHHDDKDDDNHKLDDKDHDSL